MGRYYKTAAPTFVDDNIYTPPWQLASQVLSNIDEDIAKNESTLHSLYGELEASALKADEPRVRDIVGGYESQIDELAKKIQENPLEFRREGGAIRNLGKDIHENWTRGEVAAIQGNKGAYDGWLKSELEKVKATKGYVTPEDVNYARQKFLTDFKGTQYQKGTGDYQNIYTEALNPYMNVEDIAEERGKGYIADVVDSMGAYSDGQYIYTSEDKKEFVNPEDILAGVQTAMYNDKELTNYYNQQVKLGAMSEEEKNMRIQAAATRVAEKYGYSKVSKGRKSMSGDPFALKAEEEAKAKRLAKHKYDIEHPEAVNFTERTTKPIDADDFQTTMRHTIADTQKYKDEMWKKANNLKKLGETNPQYLEALADAKQADVAVLNRKQYDLERNQDFFEQVKTRFGENSSQYKKAQELGWEGIYGIQEKSIQKPFSGGKTAGTSYKVVTNPDELELKDFHAGFTDQWAKQYADSHTQTTIFNDASQPKEGESNMYRDASYALLKSGNISFLDKDGKNPLDGAEIEDSYWFNIGGDTDFTSMKEVEKLMGQLGTDKIEDVIDVKAYLGNSTESATLKVKLTPKASALMDIDPGEFTVKVSGTNVPEVVYNQAISKGHVTSSNGKVEDAYLGVANPVLNTFIKQVQTIPSQPIEYKPGTNFADKDKSFSKIIATGQKQVKVTNEGVRNGIPVYTMEDITTGEKTAGGHTLSEVGTILAKMNQ